ncbi:cytochrome b/b6 domain-containing protein [Paracoccus litorisediminis]|uniref:cytochrome b/b6 domain-containing protein n=1 Tax=Paracoccus litorisediminis TaxID=2006130 RepID=UPI0037335DB8
MFAKLEKTARSGRATGPLVQRHALWTRITHWLWVVCFAFLLMSGLQIFNAHPNLYWGAESGFSYDNSVLQIGVTETPTGPRGRTTILGHGFGTTGVLGFSGPDGQLQARAFPAWATIPSYRDLGTGRVVHFFFAWLLVVTLVLWFLGSVLNGHLRRDILPGPRDLRDLPRDIADHLRFRFHHVARYGVLQKLSYAVVLLGLFPMIILTGLTMSPTMNAAWPWLLDLFGGRQSARTLHFVAASLMLAFLVVHLLMVLLAGPVNELRSMITGWYRTDPSETAMKEGRDPCDIR